MPTITERVAAGAAWLDEHEPGWWQRIDLDRLNLGSECRCVLGQLATDVVRDNDDDLWARICSEFGVSAEDDLDDSDDRPSDWELGFNAAFDDDRPLYGFLRGPDRRLAHPDRGAAR